MEKLFSLLFFSISIPKIENLKEKQRKKKGDFINDKTYKRRIL